MVRSAFKFVLLDEAKRFLKSLPQPVVEKIYKNIYCVAGGERNSDLFKKLINTNIWEFRTVFNKMAVRLFAFWDYSEETLVVVTHTIVKKSQKTPSKEIAKAEAIRKEWLKLKMN
ncbi:MAG: type II toxin-antitoxin system RelE/ParE family toxin [Bacteroidales bacterium]|nr:type II toxin-antitoxin system RelE/ParE family toxin [Bacteroidales bacterium]